METSNLDRRRNGLRPSVGLLTHGQLGVPRKNLPDRRSRCHTTIQIVYYFDGQKVTAQQDPKKGGMMVCPTLDTLDGKVRCVRVWLVVGLCFGALISRLHPLVAELLRPEQDRFRKGEVVKAEVG